MGTPSQGGHHVGPAVEWWADKQQGSAKEFPYSSAAMKVAELTGSDSELVAGGQLAN